MNISKDISNKLDSTIVKVLIDLTEVTAAHGIPFFVVGATARDIVFSALYNIPTTRASLDIDLGIRINSWDDFQNVVDDLINIKGYERDKKQRQRLRHSGTIVDIVPFGPIERPVGSISWPPDHDLVMKTVGFEEALQHAIEVKISSEPDVSVKVSTPPALAIMKICAWKDTYPLRGKDALDLHYLLKTYIRAGNESRLFSTDTDLLAEQLDPDSESARLLGRDAQQICSPEVKDLVNKILTAELSRDSSLRLLSDMMGSVLYDDQAADRIFQMLHQFQIGLEEER